MTLIGKSNYVRLLEEENSTMSGVILSLNAEIETLRAENESLKSQVLRMKDAVLRHTEKLQAENRKLVASGGCCEKPDYTGYAPCKSCGFDPTQ